MSSAFVTGGSGFVGGRLIERLRAEGHDVRALARSDASSERVRSLGAEPVPGELGDRAALRAGAEGCELAFHAAATLGDSGSREEFERGNVQGTENVLSACAKAGVRRLVHVSTEAVLLAGRPLVQVDESAPLQPDSRALYSATKARAEQAVIAANGERLQTVVVRPRFVWGAGDTTLLPRMVELARSGRLAWIGGGNHLTSTTHIDNTVEGLMLGAQRGRPGNVYFVTDGEPVVFREFVGELLATQGVAAPTRSIPAPVAWMLMSVGEGAARLLPGNRPPPLTRFAYWVSSQECTIRIDKVREQLGYAPVRTIEEGLAGLRVASS
jgi:nucleoside-diphosphate-sugar epimerase